MSMQIICNISLLFCKRGELCMRAPVWGSLLFFIYALYYSVFKYYMNSQIYKFNVILQKYIQIK